MCSFWLTKIDYISGLSKLSFFISVLFPRLVYELQALATECLKHDVLLDCLSVVPTKLTVYPSDGLQIIPHRRSASKLIEGL